MTTQTEFLQESLAPGHYNVVGLARRYDPDTSKQAAEKIAKKLTDLQARVLAAFTGGKEMNGGECEKLPQFETYAPSTVRHRICELADRGDLVKCGNRGGMTVYRRNV